MGKITFFNNKIKKEVNLVLKNNNYKIIDINKVLKKYIYEKNSTISWIANFTNPTGIEIFWNSISKDFIFGDHSF